MHRQCWIMKNLFHVNPLFPKKCHKNHSELEKSRYETSNSSLSFIFLLCVHRANLDRKSILLRLCLPPHSYSLFTEEMTSDKTRRKPTTKLCSLPLSLSVFHCLNNSSHQIVEKQISRPSEVYFTFFLRRSFICLCHDIICCSPLQRRRPMRAIICVTWRATEGSHWRVITIPLPSSK